MSRMRFPSLCPPAKEITHALAEASYRVGWSLASDPKSEWRPHYRLTGYVGPGGVLVVQDFFDPGAAETEGVEIYAPLTDSPYCPASDPRIARLIADSDALEMLLAGERSERTLGLNARLGEPFDPEPIE